MNRRRALRFGSSLLVAAEILERRALLSPLGLAGDSPDGGATKGGWDTGDDGILDVITAPGPGGGPHATSYP